MSDGLKILFVFVDGLGLGENNSRINPFAYAEEGPDRGLPNLRKLLSASVALDASMGVAGLPQSATGQTALLTGLNAAELMGRHVEGFPPPRLKELVREHNLFSKLLALGRRCTFANDYWLDDVAQIPSRRESVTTVATLAALGRVRAKNELALNRAVYHDLTREALRERGYTGPLISPEEAARHLMAIAEDHAFTLFEFFETDRAGHRGNSELIVQTLDKLDRFFGELWAFDGLLIVTSDHGNIEDVSTRSHTMNPVPFYASDPALLRGMENIMQVTPKLLNVAKGSNRMRV